MRKSEVINEIIVRSGIAKTITEANIIFVHAFVEHYLDWDLGKWDTQVPAHIVELFQKSVGNGHGVSVRYLIKDLDTLMKGSRSANRR